MMPLLKSVALASLVGSTLGETIYITSHKSCPLRALRESIRSQCDLDAKAKCASNSPELSLFISQAQHSPLFSSGFVPFPPPTFGMRSFDDLESMIDEMFSSTLQLFDEAMSVNMQEEAEAEERAVKAFDAQLPSFVEEIVSSASSSSSSSSDEREIDNVPPQDEQVEDAFASLIGEIMDITSHIQMDSQRRRLSEGESNDPHLKMKDRLARRLTEYVSKTELFLLPGGGTMQVVSMSPANKSPMLGLGDKDVDECIYSSYKNGDLSSGCTAAVSSFMEYVNFMDFVNPRQYGLEWKMQKQTPVQNSLAAPVPKAADETLVQTLSGVHQRLINEDDSTTRYLVYGSILSSIVLLISLCVMAVQNIWSFFAGVAVIVMGIVLGPMVMLTFLSVVIIYDQFYPSNEDNEEEEDLLADDFDYVKMNEDDDDAEVNGSMSKPRVFIGVPVQVV